MPCSTPVRRRWAPTDVPGEERHAGAARGAALLPLFRGDAPFAQLVRFAAAGGLATGVQVLLFLLLTPIGTLQSNVVAWACSTALANELHRRRTFHAAGRVGWLTAQVEGGGLALLGLGFTSGGLSALAVLVPDTGAALQALLVLAVNATVGIGRFLALRWAFVMRPQPA